MATSEKGNQNKICYFISLLNNCVGGFCISWKQVRVIPTSLVEREMSKDKHQLAISCTKYKPRTDLLWNINIAVVKKETQSKMMLFDKMLTFEILRT